MTGYINPYGVYIFNNSAGILLSYSGDSKNQIELYFQSVNSILKIFRVASIDQVKGIDLVTYI